LRRQRARGQSRRQTRGSAQTTFANLLDDKKLAELAQATETQLDVTDKATA